MRVSTHLLLQQKGTACHAASAVALIVMYPGVGWWRHSWQVQMLIAVHASLPILYAQWHVSIRLLA